MKTVLFPFVKQKFRVESCRIVKYTKRGARTSDHKIGAGCDSFLKHICNDLKESSKSKFFLVVHLCHESLMYRFQYYATLVPGSKKGTFLHVTRKYSSFSHVYREGSRPASSVGIA